MYKIGTVQQVSEKFKKCECIIEVAGQYPQYIAVQFTQDKIDLLNGVGKEAEVTAHINLRGRLWINKEQVEQAFNSLEVWKLDVSGSAPSSEGRAVVNVDDSLPF